MPLPLPFTHVQSLSPVKIRRNWGRLVASCLGHRMHQGMGKRLVLRSFREKMKASEKPQGGFRSQNNWDQPLERENLTGAAINSRNLVFGQFNSPYSSIRLSILLVALGMCVFFWGLGYKLSLYETHQASFHQIPEAKLLSHNEDRNAVEGVRVCLVKAEVRHQSSPSAPVILLWLLSVAALRANREWLCFSNLRPWCLSLDLIRNALYFRPPPIFCRQ